jgi:hypothetical protein
MQLSHEGPVRSAGEADRGVCRGRLFWGLISTITVATFGRQARVCRSVETNLSRQGFIFDVPAQ